jgi:hypothetical protein
VAPANVHGRGVPLAGDEWPQSPTPPALPRCPNPQPRRPHHRPHHGGSRRQRAVAGHQAPARRRRQRAQALRQDRVGHHDRRHAVAMASLERVPDPAVRQFGQPRLAHRRTASRSA